MASVRPRQQRTSGSSLLDRLTELQPNEISNATLQRGEMPMGCIEDAVYRDLCWLVQTSSLDQTQDLSPWPHVRRSVLNYGVPIFTGKILGNAELSDIEAAIKKAILIYEPRLLKDSLEVRSLQDRGDSDHREIRVDVLGQVVVNEVRMPISLEICIDSDSGRFEIERND